MSNQTHTIEHIYAPATWEGSEGLLAILIPAHFRPEGLHFATPPELAQQVAVMTRPAGEVIAPHVHYAHPRTIHGTPEVLLIRKGRVRADIYTSDRHHVCTRFLEAGDVLVLVSGGHGFDVLEEADIVEVKQGPFRADRDKVRFEGVKRG